MDILNLILDLSPFLILLGFFPGIGLGWGSNSSTTEPYGLYGELYSDRMNEAQKKLFEQMMGQADKFAPMADEEYAKLASGQTAGVVADLTKLREQAKREQRQEAAARGYSGSGLESRAIIEAQNPIYQQQASAMQQSPLLAYKMRRAALDQMANLHRTILGSSGSKSSSEGGNWNISVGGSGGGG